MKTVHYKFEKDNLAVKDGQIIELDPIVTECDFALTLESLALFEDEYGKPLVNTLMGGTDKKGNATGDEMGRPEFIRALAASTYIKLENNQVFQNESTREEFKKLDIYRTCATDFLFSAQLITMASAGIEERTNKKIKELEEGTPRRKNAS